MGKWRCWPAPRQESDWSFLAKSWADKLPTRPELLCLSMERNSASLKTKAGKCSSLAHPFGALYHACFLQVSVMAIIDGERKQLLYLHPLAGTGKMSFSPWLWNTRNYKQTQTHACAFPRDRITSQTLFCEGDPSPFEAASTENSLILQVQAEHQIWPITACSTFSLLCTT